MLGFRSHKLWKKILSVTYLVFWGIIFLVSMLDGKFKNITTYDFIITKIQNLILLTILASPYIFLSKTKLRSKMPLFKTNKKFKSFLGLIIVNIILFIIFGVVNGFHSKEYLVDMANHNYQVVERIEASCENAGTIDYQCDYCGTTKTDTIDTLGHDLKEVSKTEAVCEKGGLIIKKCERCGKTEETVISESGHKMKEITKKQPTENDDGNIVWKCTVCNKEEVEILRRLGKAEEEYKSDGTYYINIGELSEEIHKNTDEFVVEESPFTYVFDEAEHIVGNCSVVLKKIEIVNIPHKSYGSSSTYAKHIRIQATVKNNYSQETYLTSKKTGNIIGKYYGNEGDTIIGWNNNYKWQIDSSIKADFGWTIKPNQTRDICIAGVFIDSDRLKYNDEPQIDLYFVNECDTLTLSIN